MNRIKVLIVCHFSNATIREHLPLDNRRLYNCIRRLIGLSPQGKEYADLASWDTNLIDNLSKREDVELYVISAHSGLKKAKVHFAINNVKYWFIRCDYATMLKHFIKSPALWHKLNPMRPTVRKIVRKVNPDVIGLVGAENPHISGTVLGLEKEYPILVKAQTIYNNPQRSKLSVFDLKNAYVERLIFDRLNYFSIIDKTYLTLFRQYCPKAWNLKWYFGTTYPKVKPLEKEYDFANFAMIMSAKKGFHDALRALTIVKRKYPSVRLNLIGGGTDEEVNIVKNLVGELDLNDNVVLTPLFPKQEDMLQHIQRARFALLPCKMDYVAGTIRQAMYYGLPVICYKTEGTVALNENEEKVLIAENGNVEDLAEKMERFLRETELTDRLRKKAKEYADATNNNEKITEQLMADFKAVISNFNNGTPVPDDLLYDKV